MAKAYYDKPEHGNLYIVLFNDSGRWQWATAEELDGEWKMGDWAHDEDAKEFIKNATEFEWGGF